MVRRPLFAVLVLSGALGACGSTSELGALVPPTADEDPHVPQLAIEVAGHARRVHLETFGERGRPVLLLLHGSLSDFRGLLPLTALSDRYFVVAWDQRGNGLSERIPRSEYTFESVVEEIGLIKERFSPERPVTLVGHSFGAMYSALYTSRRPSDVEQLALLEPGGLNGAIFTSTFPEIIDIDLLERGQTEMFWQSEVLSPSNHAIADYKQLMILRNGKQTRYFCDRENPPVWPVWRPGAFVEYVRAERMGATSGFSSTSFEFDFSSGLDAFPREVLLVGGSCSALGPEYQRKYHQPLFRDARVVAIDHVGHRMVVERPDAVLAALRGYLNEYSGVGPQQ